MKYTSTTTFSSFPGAFILFCLLWSTSMVAQSSSLVWLDGGSLSYAPFAVQDQTNAVHVIPDFSYAGYRGGGVAIPVAPVEQTLSPSGGDDTPAIQAAIDAVESLPLNANGFRGAVLLQAGRYNIDQLFIEESGVVLRGEGQGLDGTVLFAQLQTRHDVITIQGSGGGFDRQGSSQQRITTPYVPIGSNSFDIADASGYVVGETIVVRRTPNQFWIDELGMDSLTLCAGDPGCNGWTPGSYTIDHERVITDISGNAITINIPIVDVMEDQYGGGEVYKASVPGRIEQCGVENLRIESYYDPNDTEDEDHAWIGVHLKRTMNSWVTNVTGQHLAYGTISITNESNFNTIQECAAIDHISQVRGGRRYSFNIGDGLGNLIQRCYTREGRHDLVTGSRVTGPNVFLDNFSASTLSDIGPHHRWATGTLFDNVRGGQIQVQNRGSGGSGHGWAGNTTMFWNVVSYKRNVKVESPRGGINWGIGNTGLQQDGAGFWESWNTPVLPRSLYLQQLEDRLGTQAVENITIPEQRTGDIYDLLEAWAGENEFGEPASTQTVYPVADAFVRGGVNSDNNYGTDDQLVVKENGGTDDNDRRSFLRFDLSNVISPPLEEAILRLYVSNDPPNPADNALHLVNDDSWSELGITWNNQPAVASLIETKQVTTQGVWLEYDITTIANTEIAGDGILSLRLSEASVGNYYAFSSKEENNINQDPQIIYRIGASTEPEPSTAGLGLIKNGSFQDENNDGIAQVGETIDYTFTIRNTGEESLSNVTVSDPLISVIGDPITNLAGGETDNTSFSGTYTLTQADLERGSVSNQASVEGSTSNETVINDLSDPISLESDNFTITNLPGNPGIAVVKSGVLNDSNNDGCSEPGETITYTFTVTNTSSESLENVQISDPLFEAPNPTVAMMLASGDLNNDQLLDGDETWIYTADYLITQADIDAGNITNQATATATASSDGSFVYSELWGEAGNSWDQNGRIRDFTDAGYMQGNDPIPNWPVGVNVLDFGAVVNDGNDDTQAIRDAIAACGPMQAVYFPNGTYVITDTIRIYKNNIVLRGEDMYQTILSFPSGLRDTISTSSSGLRDTTLRLRPPFDDYTNWGGFFLAEGNFNPTSQSGTSTHRSMENFTFEFPEVQSEGHFSDYGANAIELQGCRDSWIRNILIKNCNNGVFVRRSSYISVFNIEFDNYPGRVVPGGGDDGYAGHNGIKVTSPWNVVHDVTFLGTDEYEHNINLNGSARNNIFSRITGSDMQMDDHGGATSDNLFTEIDLGEGTPEVGRDTYRGDHPNSVWWNIKASTTQSYAGPDPTNSSVVIGLSTTESGDITQTEYWHETIDPDALCPPNLYLAQLDFLGKPLPENETLSSCATGQVTLSDLSGTTADNDTPTSLDITPCDPVSPPDDPSTPVAQLPAMSIGALIILGLALMGTVIFVIGRIDSN